MTEAEKIANTLGRIEGGITSSKEEFARFREENVRQVASASEGRQRIYTTLNEFKDRITGELLDIKLKQRTVELQVEDLNNKLSGFQPNLLDIPLIRTAVDDLEEGHKTITASITTLETLKNQIQGGVAASKIWSTMAWAIVVAVSGVVSASITALWHYLSTGGASPPGR